MIIRSTRGGAAAHAVARQHAWGRGGTRGVVLDGDAKDTGSEARQRREKEERQKREGWRTENLPPRGGGAEGPFILPPFLPPLLLGSTHNHKYMYLRTKQKTMKRDDLLFNI